MSSARGEGPPAAARRLPLRAYVIGLVVLVVLVAAVRTVYERDQARADARHAAMGDARFAARLGAEEIRRDLDATAGQVAALAANPALAQVFEGPGGCTLTFTGAGAFTRGHLDIVDRAGGVACSSRAVSADAGYAGASWLAGPPTLAPVTDARTGKRAIVSTAPVGEAGVVAAFLDLDSLAPSLEKIYGGPRHLEFEVHAADGTVLARSTTRDGERYTGSATVPGQRWKVTATVDRDTALAAANRLSNRELVISIVGVLLVLIAAWIIHRRLTRPIARLSASVRAGTAIEVTGPREVASLAEDLRALMEAGERELIAVSRLAAIVEASADSIIGLDLDGRITSWNEGARRTYGYTADEAIGQNIALLRPDGASAALTSGIEQLGQGERFEHIETQRRCKDGSFVDVSLTLSPIHDIGGGIVGFSSVAQTITDRKHADQERLALADRLHQAQRLESLGQLAGGVAHDFNNLLGVILNYSSFVAEHVEDEGARADLEMIRTAAERAARLTRQLLIFGRRETIQPELLDLNAIVADVHELLERSLGEHVALDVDHDPDLAAVLADRGQIEQVLLNLAVNARDAMPGGGRLTIETRTTILDEEYTRLHPDVPPGRYVELTVSDTGTGMSPEVASRVFEPFFTTKAKGEGSGLGLATVYGIVREAGGGIGIYSEEGIGTTFRVFLPAVSQAASPLPTSASGGARGRGETVLVVEDEAAMMEVAARILRRHGYVVFEAPTGTAALELAAEHDIDLLLTDSVMPQMSGQELAASIHAIRPGLPVLFMSGYSRGVLGPRSVVDDGRALIEKPFNEHGLLTKVRAVLDSD